MSDLIERASLYKQQTKFQSSVQSLYNMLCYTTYPLTSILGHYFFFG